MVAFLIHHLQINTELRTAYPDNSITGGPPTTVTWRKDGQLINETRYERSQMLLFTENSTYENTLFSNDVASFVGSFTCEVSNVRGTAQETMELNGEEVLCSGKF